LHHAANVALTLKVRLRPRARRPSGPSQEVARERHESRGHGASKALRGGESRYRKWPVRLRAYATEAPRSAQARVTGVGRLAKLSATTNKKGVRSIFPGYADGK
jgi:hypothetical protein